MRWRRRPLLRFATFLIRKLTGAIDPIDSVHTLDRAIDSIDSVRTLPAPNAAGKTRAPAPQAEMTMVDGSPVTADHREIQSDGMQKGYVVLSQEERDKGFVRPVRRSYVHDTCGAVTTMSVALAETCARDPKFYGGMFCATCKTHFPVAEFVWDGTGPGFSNPPERVGS